MKYERKELNENIIRQLIDLSKKWHDEECTWGIVANTEEDLKEPLFVAEDNDTVVGYIFGHYYVVENKTSYIEIGSKCFMIDEIYVLPPYRNKGTGKRLFELMEAYVKDTCEYITLSTATKNYKDILHFYVDELDMNFHSAFLIKEMVEKRTV